MQTRSIPGYNRGAVTTKLVADAIGNHADIRPGVRGNRSKTGASAGAERVAPVRSEKIVVFNAGSPVRGETILKADTDHAAPTGPFRLRNADAGRGVADIERWLRRQRCPLHKQRCVPGVTNLPREEPQAIDVGFPGVRRVDRLMRSFRRLAQSPWASNPNTQVPACQR